MGLFGEYDANEIAELPEGLDNDTYPAIISEAVAKASAAGTSFGLLISYTIQEHPVYSGWTQNTWDRVPQPNDTLRDKDGELLSENPEKMAKTLAYLKQRLLKVCVPESECNTVQPRDLIGKKVWITTAKQKDNPRYSRVVAVEPRNEDGGEFNPTQPVKSPFGG